MYKVDALFDFMKKDPTALIPTATKILYKMQNEKGYTYHLVQNILTYFLGPYTSKGTIADAFSLVYQRRIRFLYFLKDLFEQEAAFQKSFLRFKKETSNKKMGCHIMNMERQLAFISAGIIQDYQSQIKTVIQNKHPELVAQTQLTHC